MEFMGALEDILVPIFICALLPAAIVWIVFHSQVTADRLRAQVLIKAIESNNGIDADKLAEAMQKPRKTPAERQRSRLLCGCLFSLLGLCSLIYALVLLFAKEPDSDFFIIAGICLPVGISYLVVYLMSRKDDSKA
ncbi:MAG: hypothetical protein NC406_09925 [Bacteroides sp.]|nr:hypothetical protein [Bacteroides sp.]MCM1096331.1 hypothetical protein [Terasakiella sp.]